MKDIIERLRERQAHWAGQPDYYGGDLFKDAADRIEILLVVLGMALPDLEENYRFLRDVQADPNRILRAADVLGHVRRALGKPKP